MKPQQVMIGVVAGCLLIVFGLVPGLLHNLAEGVRNACESISSGLPVCLPRRTGADGLRRPVWLAGIGALLIVLTVLAYVSS